MKVATDLKNAKNAPKNPFFKSKLQAKEIDKLITRDF